MARTIAEIKKEMTDAFMADETLRQKYGFDPTRSFAEQFSKVSLESILFYIVAASEWVLETMFDKHQKEVGDVIGKRAHTLAWYREKALAFQMGRDLSDETAEYDNTGVPEDVIAQERIVTKCSSNAEDAVFPTISIKAVTASGKMTANQLTAFRSYMEEIADAGVHVNCLSLDPDILGLRMTIWYDKLLMNAEGTLYNEEKENAVWGYINDYLAQLPFNGALYPRMLEAYLMQCPGVKMAKIEGAFETYDTGDDTAEESLNNLDAFIPHSGAFVYNGPYTTGQGELYDITYTAFNG